MAVLVGGGSAGQETLRITNRRSEDWMPGGETRVEDDDSGRVGRRVGHLIQLLNIGPDEYLLQADSRGEIDGANVPMSEKVVRHG